VFRKSKKKIRPHGELSPSPGGTTHLPVDMRKELGFPEKIPYVMNAHTVVLFNPHEPPEKILESLRVIMKDIELRVVEE